MNSLGVGTFTAGLGLILLVLAGMKTELDELGLHGVRSFPDGFIITGQHERMSGVRRKRYPHPPIAFPPLREGGQGYLPILSRSAWTVLRASGVIAPWLIGATWASVIALNCS